MSSSTNPIITNDLRIAARQSLLPRKDSGWLAGFGNLLSKELGEWFGTRRWMVQLLIWLGMINGFIAFMLFVVPAIDPAGVQAEGNPPLNVMGWTLYFSFVTLAGSIGMTILVQDEVIQEKQSGTAAWILSKPVARQAFILTKWISSLIGGLLFIVFLPFLGAFAEVYLLGQPGLPVLPLLGGVGVVSLVLVFYASLVILLGVLFEQRGPVLGIAFAVMFGGMIVAQFVPPLSYILPIQTDQVALAMVMGQTLPPVAISQLVLTAVWSILFITLAVVRFKRIEF